MKLKRTLFTIVSLTLSSLLLTASCQPVEPRNVTPETPSDTAWCSAGCTALQRLTGRDGKPGCEESRSISGPNGEITTCEEFCRNTQESGRNLYPSCWVKVTTCAEVEELRKRPYPCEGH